MDTTEARLIQIETALDQLRQLLSVPVDEAEDEDKSVFERIGRCLYGYGGSSFQLELHRKRPDGQTKKLKLPYPDKPEMRRLAAEHRDIIAEYLAWYISAAS